MMLPTIRAVACGSPKEPPDAPTSVAFGGGSRFDVSLMARPSARVTLGQVTRRDPMAEAGGLGDTSPSIASAGTSRHLRFPKNESSCLMQVLHRADRCARP